MTQQPYGQSYPPQQGYPPQQYAPQPPQQFAPPMQQPNPYVQPQGYPPQQYAPQQPPQGPPPAPLVQGTLDDYFAQPSGAGGPAISWKGAPDGHTVYGIVARDVTAGDVQQEVGAPNTEQAGRPQFYRDGRPKFVMIVPLKVQPSQTFPEGEARLYVRGALRDELVRAMSEARVEGAPTEGSAMAVTLTARKPGRGSIPRNEFRVTYTPASAINSQAPQQTVAPSPAPVQQVPQAPTVGQNQPQQWAQPPAQQSAPQAPAEQQWVNPAYTQAAQAAQAPQPTFDQAAAQQGPPPTWAGQPGQPQQGAPVQQQAPQAQMPADFSPEQQALMAKLTGQG